MFFCFFSYGLWLIKSVIVIVIYSPVEKQGGIWRVHWLWEGWKGESKRRSIQNLLWKGSSCCCCCCNCCLGIFFSNYITLDHRSLFRKAHITLFAVLAIIVLLDPKRLTDLNINIYLWFNTTTKRCFFGTAKYMYLDVALKI